MDEKFFLEMVDKFNSSGMAVMEFNDGNVHLFLKKESTNNESSTHTPVHLGIPAQASAETICETGEKIKSPIVGTFYSSPSPDDPPFVEPGTKIKAGQKLCILEAMKMMNHLEVEFDCEIIEVHATSGELVEFGQDLFTVIKN